jgi:hypothetical protein
MRFVGEMILAVEADISRNEMYAQSARFGLNREKSRWIASFLEETELIEQPRYGSLRATPTGLAIAAELPMADPPEELQVEISDELPLADETEIAYDAEALVLLAESPQARGLSSGRAFEEATRDAFRELGFRAQTVGGSGDTDIVVTWLDGAGTKRTAIVEAKSRSNGHVSHTDISDVALETHKTRNHADFAAIVGPSFSGETIKEMAAKRRWALLDARRLADIVVTAKELGLGPAQTGVLFQVPNGQNEIDKLFEEARRRLAIVTFVIAQLLEEDNEAEEAITARDIARDGRRSDLRPNIDEVLDALELVKRCAPTAIRVTNAEKDAKFSTHVLGDVKSAVSELRALCRALESPIRHR